MQDGHFERWEWSRARQKDWLEVFTCLGNSRIWGRVRPWRESQLRSNQLGDIRVFAALPQYDNLAVSFLAAVCPPSPPAMATNPEPRQRAIDTKNAWRTYE